MIWIDIVLRLWKLESRCRQRRNLLNDPFNINIFFLQRYLNRFSPLAGCLSNRNITQWLVQTSHKLTSCQLTGRYCDMLPSCACTTILCSSTSPRVFKRGSMTYPNLRVSPRFFSQSVRKKFMFYQAFELNAFSISPSSIILVQRTDYSLVRIFISHICSGLSKHTRDTHPCNLYEYTATQERQRECRDYHRARLRRCWQEAIPHPLYQESRLHRCYREAQVWYTNVSCQLMMKRR